MKRIETKNYESPEFEILEVQVESGFSTSYGDLGDAGQDSDYNDYGGDL